MKALKKILIGVATVAMSAAALSFAACGSTTEYEGEYKYANTYAAGSYYGVKVSVTLNSKDKIKSVSVLESDYIEVSDTNATYGWDQTVYTNAKDNLLKAYKGKTAAEIMAQYVACEDSGEPTIQSADGFNAYDSDLIITGSTQGSGRLLLAVQNALESAGYKSYVGEYKYANTYAAGSYYGVKVNVVVKDSTIQKVAVIDSDYIEVSDSNATYGWDQTVYTNAKEDLLAAYEGKTVAEINAITVACEDSGEPTIQSADGFVAYDTDLLITGSTQGSGRLILAVQNALSNI